jgi:hypothetical protein
MEDPAYHIQTRITKKVWHDMMSIVSNYKIRNWILDFSVFDSMLIVCMNIFLIRTKSEKYPTAHDTREISSCPLLWDSTNYNFLYIHTHFEMLIDYATKLDLDLEQRTSNIEHFI